MAYFIFQGAWMKNLQINQNILQVWTKIFSLHFQNTVDITKPFIHVQHCPLNVSRMHKVCDTISSSQGSIL